ncbi:hypothetical protein [Corynebacterium aquilae]|uniref:hypothetical protein n=1 Tax=Corynebacterium aquilae TaxID=203263 RepID=UPI0012EE119E|nr:hypothetical protein [Corynebacterium aquilae]
MSYTKLASLLAYTGGYATALALPSKLPTVAKATIAGTWALSLFGILAATFVDHAKEQQ